MIAADANNAARLEHNDKSKHLMLHIELKDPKTSFQLSFQQNMECLNLLELPFLTICIEGLFYVLIFVILKNVNVHLFFSIAQS